MWSTMDSSVKSIASTPRHRASSAVAGRKGRGGTALWRPADVLAVRSRRKDKRDNLHRAHTTANRALARARQNEAFRQRILARIAARRAA
jgi:hypothetical protein